MYNISIIIDIKNSQPNVYENIIIHSGNNCNASNIYDDYELEGINKYIKTNNKILILEFDNIKDICDFIKFIKTLREIKIEYIYYNNNILYASNKYINSLNKELYNKKDFINIISKNKEIAKYKQLYNCL